MLNLKHEITTIASTIIMLTACSPQDDGDPGERQLVGDAVAEHESLEQMLDLVPQTTSAARLTGGSYIVDGTTPRYVIFDTDAGPIDLEAIEITNDAHESGGLTELFPDAPSSTTGQLVQDALLLVAVPEEHVEELCERFQFAHDDADLVTVEGQPLLFRTPAFDGLAHALCLMPLASQDDAVQGAARSGVGPATNLAAEADPQGYGSGTYTVWVRALKANNPRDWENWPYNGDEARLRAFYDGIGGSKIWDRDNVKSGNVFQTDVNSPYNSRTAPLEEYIHFNANAKLELYDFDGGLWNANDKLGQEWVYSGEACGGDHYGDFDGSGGGHSWNYDLTYQVFGPGCPCQTQRPVVEDDWQSESCSVTSQTVTHYTYYCSGGTEWQQAWGDITRHCQTHEYIYNVACEMSTFVSQTLMSECDKYQYGVAIGSPTATGGVCPGGGGGDGCIYPYAEHAPSFEDQLHSGEPVPEVEPLIEPVCPV